MDAPMTHTDGRPRWPWVVWLLVMAALVVTLALSVRNDSFREDPFFIPIAVMMIVGYTSVGALLVSRTRANPIAWLLLAVGVLFVLTGLSDEYLQSATEAGRSDSTLVATTALLTSLVWLPMLGVVSLLLLLFPTGAVPGPKWWPLPWLIAAGITMFLVGTTLHPGPLDPEETGIPEVIRNPLGVEALGAVTGVLTTVGSTLGLLWIPPALAGLLVRYRRSVGDERQQIRWLAYVVATIVALVALQFAVALVPGDGQLATFASDVLFLVTFALVGVGIPVTTAIAVLRYRLYDLDVVIRKTVIFAITVVVVMVAGVGLLLALSTPLTDIAPDETQAVGIAGLVIGVLVFPLWRIAWRVGDRFVYGGRTTPYEALTEFSGRLSEAYATDDVLPRMATVLGESTRAAVAHVWVLVGGVFRDAASWPSDDTPAASVAVEGDALPSFPGADKAVEVRHRGELLGALTVTSHASDPVDTDRLALMHDLAGHAGIVLRNVRLIEELRASRQRLVAAQDEERRKLERNIHDGAQQQLVAMSVKARLAGSLVGKSPDRTASMLEEIQRDLTDALENLRDLARGIYPPLLADQGLAAAITAQARKSTVPVRVEADGAGRYPPEIEATVYFCVLEALQNVAKYAGATRTSVELEAIDRQLRFSVTDDGRGFDAATVTPGSGLQGIADRLSAVGGELEVRSAPGRGTTVAGRVPAEEVRPA
jgi:signal transduction histidine kinase